jgi:hypothetical protein
VDPVKRICFTCVFLLRVLTVGCADVEILVLCQHLEKSFALLTLSRAVVDPWDPG